MNVSMVCTDTCLALQVNGKVDSKLHQITEESSSEAIRSPKHQACSRLLFKVLLLRVFLAFQGLPSIADTNFLP